MRIPIETFRLSNGLFVTLSEDHTAPIVAVNLWYHVGSANERVEQVRIEVAQVVEHEDAGTLGRNPILAFDFEPQNGPVERAEHAPKERHPPGRVGRDAGATGHLVVSRDEVGSMVYAHKLTVGPGPTVGRST
jgi:hypothetical protein